MTYFRTVIFVVYFFLSLQVFPGFKSSVFAVGSSTAAVTALDSVVKLRGAIAVLKQLNFPEERASPDGKDDAFYRGFYSFDIRTNAKRAKEIKAALTDLEKIKNLLDPYRFSKHSSTLTLYLNQISSELKYPGWWSDYPLVEPYENTASSSLKTIRSEQRKNILLAKAEIFELLDLSQDAVIKLEGNTILAISSGEEGLQGQAELRIFFEELLSVYLAQKAQLQAELKETTTRLGSTRACLTETNVALQECSRQVAALDAQKAAALELLRRTEEAVRNLYKTQIDLLKAAGDSPKIIIWSGELLRNSNAGIQGTFETALTELMKELYDQFKDSHRYRALSGSGAPRPKVQFTFTVKAVAGRLIKAGAYKVNVSLATEVGSIEVSTAPSFNGNFVLNKNGAFEPSRLKKARTRLEAVLMSDEFFSAIQRASASDAEDFDDMSKLGKDLCLPPPFQEDSRTNAD